MANGVNLVTFIGHLGRDPELKYSQGGLAIANFSLAVGETYNGKTTTLWINAVAFGKLAEICGKYLKKGRQIYINGKLKDSSYVDKEGIKHSKFEVVISNMTMLGSSSNQAQSEMEEDVEERPVPGESYKGQMPVFPCAAVVDFPKRSKNDNDLSQIFENEEDIPF